MIDQTPLRVLLEDRLFRAWFERPPRPTIPHPNWRVYVQKKEGGKWYRLNVKSWKKGKKFVLKNLDKYYDMALNCGNWESRPPVVRRGTSRVLWWPGERTDHHWCGYCRRPTQFAYFRTHHAFTNPPLPYILRCAVCGHSLDGLTKRKKG